MIMFTIMGATMFKEVETVMSKNEMTISPVNQKS